MTGSLLGNEHVLGSSQIGLVSNSFAVIILVFYCGLRIDLVDQVNSLTVLLEADALLFQEKILLCLLWPKMSLVEDSFLVFHKLLLLPIAQNLLFKEFLVLNIILFLQQLIMVSDNILLLLLPPKLFFLEVSDIFDFFAFLYESIMCLVIDLL